MVRKIVLIIGGISLSAVLLVLTSWLVLNFTSFGKLVQQESPPTNVTYDQVVATHGDPFELMEITLAAVDFVGMPLTALLVGCFVGLMATKGAASAAATSLLPLSIFILATHSFSILGFVLASVCLTVGAFSSLAVSRFKSRRSRTPTTG